ncbi:FKBP-type peptidyl-prolyl cis-trans isomerase [Aquimarina sp. 2304DJ70-9]|uniref:FKBP-type peptidyl-prolyl cis-trans isomerase n=1 Tax=Aquimarina penaris TaxID=3231044 RepID=UPI0034619110
MIKKTIVVLSMIALTFSCKSDDDNSVPIIPPISFEYTQEEKDAEIVRIEDYIIDNDITGMIKTESGLFYRIDQQGDGLTPEEGDQVIFHFKTTNLETEELLGESNRENNPYGQVVRFDYLIEGFKEGLFLVNEGSILTMLVPAYLCYGKYGQSYGDNYISAETNLMFEVELNIVVKP